MTDLTHVHVATAAPDRDTEAQAYGLAATAVMASKFRRPTLRVRQARLRPEATLTFEVNVTDEALRHNRTYLEETVMVELAPHAARRIKFGAAPDAQDLAAARRRLHVSAHGDEERVAVDAYMAVLLARATDELRRSWAEVEIVTIGLLGHGALDGSEIEHRLRCAGGIRGATLN